MTSDEPAEAPEIKRSRRSFLRTLGVFLGAGIGVALVPGNALAQSGRCCVSRNPPCTSCPAGELPYDCSGCGSSCCKCLPDIGECRDAPCPCP